MKTDTLGERIAMNEDGTETEAKGAIEEIEGIGGIGVIGGIGEIGETGEIEVRGVTEATEE